MSDDRRRKRFTIIATILGSTIVFLDATVVNVALPAIRPTRSLPVVKPKPV